MHQIHVLLFLLVDLIVIILAARAFGMLARRVGQPAVIGEVVAGILLGPTVLGQIFPDLPGYVFPPAVPLKELADLGLVFFMFLVGLEMDTSLMQKEARRSLVISVSGILTPFLLGLGLAIFLAPVNNEGTFMKESTHAQADPDARPDPAQVKEKEKEKEKEKAADEPPSTFAFGLFLGAAMCITAFPILARFLVETGMYKTPIGISALCAAAVDDAIAWILLAAVIGITKTGSPAEALPALGLTLVFTAFMFTVGRWLLGLLAHRYEATGSLTIDQVAIILTGVLASAFVTEIIGIHAIFGAFIFGVVMPKHSGMTHALNEKIEGFTVVVLLPVFFAVVGLRTNLLTLDSVELLGWTGLILLVAILGKFLGTGLAAYFTGSSKRDSLVVGALMNTRGLTELVILSIGLSLGVLSDRTFAMMVIMALVTTLMAAPIVNFLMPRSEIIGALAGPSPPEEQTPEVRILVTISNPLNGPALVETAVCMTGQRRPAELLIVKLIPSTLAPEFSSGLLDIDMQVEATIEELKPLVDQARAAGVWAHVVCFQSENLALDLARLAGNQHCDGILLGWHRTLLQPHALQALVHHTFVAASSKVVVLVDRSGHGIASVDHRPIVVVLSGGPHDEGACTLGTHLARKFQTPLRLVGFFHAAPAGKSLAETAAALARESGLTVDAVPMPGDDRAILRQELAGATLGVIVVSNDWVMEQDFGNPTHAIVDAAECPMLVLRAANWVGAPRRRLS